jgi:nucleotide-binding universal stress UspA family protein
VFGQRNALKEPTMERILVGVDGSPASRDVLRWSANLAERAGLDMVVARAFAPAQAELDPGRDDVLHHEQLTELDEWCAALPASTPRPRTLLVDGSPPDALLMVASEQRADLLAVGGRGSGGFSHLHIGSVAHHLTHHTTLPLAIVPRTGSAPVEHVVLGVDGSPGSRAAVEFCAEFAAGLGVSVTAVYAFDPLLEWVPEHDPSSWHHKAEADVRSWTAPLEAAGVAVEIDIDRDTHPVAAITRAIDTHTGSMAVVGTRGLGGFTGSRLGRVPLQLVHHTTATVILVPPTT